MNSPKITRRQALATTALALALPSGGAAWAQTSKPLRLLVPFPAGGTADVLPRILADKLRSAYPGGVVVENKPGAGGNIGAEQVFRSEPDGLTLLVSPPGPIAINQSLYPKLGYDPDRWVPVTVLASVPNVLALGPKLAVKTVPELLAYLKANPGKVSYASQGNGSTSHLTANMFMALTGTEMVHIPYKGTSPALVDLMGGQVDLFFDNLGSSMVHHKAGKLRILAVADNQRSPAMPDLPTFAEAGVPGMDAVTWFAVMAPPGTPDAVVRSTQAAMSAALQLPDVRARFAEQGADPRGGTPEETARFVRGEVEKWRQVIRSAKVKVE